MATVHIVSAGYDHHLMQSRSMMLRHAGFIVDEAYNPLAILGVIQTDSVDAVVLCHTIPENEQRVLIASMREVCRLLPIISIQGSIYDTPVEDCFTSTKEPEYLLAIIRKAIHHPKGPVGLPKPKSQAS
jgi:DNA-binding response OmpR family regulator